MLSGPRLIVLGRSSSSSRDSGQLPYYSLLLRRFLRPRPKSQFKNGWTKTKFLMTRLHASGY